MMADGVTQGHMTDYERAVCYYTLPKVVHPFTLGLLVAYAVCLFEAVAAVAVGLLWEQKTLMNAGLVAFSAMVVFGLVVFTVRAILNEVRQRRALAAARGAPDALSESDSLPDPFATHVLLRRSFFSRDTIQECTKSESPVAYFVERGSHGKSWHIQNARKEEVCHVKVLRGAQSFTLGRGLPAAYAVYKGEEEIGRIVRQFSLTSSVVEIYVTQPRMPRLIVRDFGIYVEEHLQGRIYELRQAEFLDAHEAVFSPVLLAYFVTLSG